MEKQTSAWAYVCGVFTTAFGGVTLDKVAMIVGIIFTIGTFVVNWYYKEAEYRLKREKYGKGE